MLCADPIKLVVLHTDPLASAGLSVIFADCPDLDVQKAPPRSYHDHHRPWWQLQGGVDVVVSDYQSGVELASQIARRSCSEKAPKVMVIAGIDREWEIRTALEHGVRGYLLTGCSVDELIAGVRSVHRGVRHLSPQVAACLAESISVERLTMREEEVLRLVVQGQCNKVIGRQLGIAVGTVKSHLKSTFAKLGVESRTQAIAVVERRGLFCRARSLSTMAGPPGAARSSRVPLFGEPTARESHPEYAMARSN
jgi:DNA-binding NarL/FixJ family response regulator